MSYPVLIRFEESKYKKALRRLAAERDTSMNLVGEELLIEALERIAPPSFFADDGPNEDNKPSSCGQPLPAA